MQKCTRTHTRQPLVGSAHLHEALVQALGDVQPRLVAVLQEPHAALAAQGLAGGHQALAHARAAHAVGDLGGQRAGLRAVQVEVRWASLGGWLAMFCVCVGGCGLWTAGWTASRDVCNR